MIKKVKAAEVSCIIDGSGAYDQIYNTLRDSLSSDEEMIFAERSSGYGFLQWNLPGEGWIALDKADPIQAIEVKKELDKRVQHVRTLFGDNRSMADKVLTFPDDSYVFYKFGLSGKLLILITAWGYQHPVKIVGGSADGQFSPEQTKETVTLQFIYGGKPMAEKPFLLNGMEKRADAEGNFVVGSLPVDYQFDLEVNGKKHRVTVAEGKGQICIDATMYTIVEVVAVLDGQPYENVTVNVNYCGQQLMLVSNRQGMTSAQLPLGANEQLCTVTIDSESQSKPLSDMPTRFAFDFVTPKPELEPKPEPLLTPDPQPILESEPNPQPTPSPVPDPQPISDPVPQPEPEPQPVSKSLRWDVRLFFLGLLLLVATTYYFGWHFLRQIL